MLQGSASAVSDAGVGAWGLQPSWGRSVQSCSGAQALGMLGVGEGQGASSVGWKKVV